jgi:light-regulated signal transduction histidine kinase (bacteriophytochrome)
VNTPTERSSHNYPDEDCSDLEQANEVLQRSNDDLEQFVRIASHDLRAPLGTMVRTSEWLLRAPDEEPEIKENALRFLLTSGKRLLRLLDDLQQYVSLSHGPPSAPAQVDQALDHALKNLGHEIEQSKARIQVDIHNQILAPVPLGMLTVVFQNIVANAIKYRRPDENPVVQVTAQEKESCWKLSLRDNGQGFNDAFAAQIFDPFHRLHGYDVPGSGIGLSVCKRIIEKVGGRIWAESTEGEGSTFHIQLPKV